jgi:dTDP-4-amino-4,6-dideoxygalactose transaminase
MPVPFLDLGAQDREVGAAVRAAVAEVLDSRQYVLGPYGERFEAAMAEYCGVPFALGVASGTDALALGLSALGVGPGTRVLTTPFSFWATASTILRLGARPVFADVDPETLNLDPAAVEAVLERDGAGIAGIVPVHLFGRIADMDALQAIAARRGLWVLEDAAQAVGARVDGRAAGAIGNAAAVSFYPTKNLGGLGDGGMLLTADPAVAEHVRRERNQGLVAPYVHQGVGLCSRLDAIQAAALGAKLPHLDDWNARRRAIAGWYAEGFAAAGLTGGPDAPLRLPSPAGAAHVFHVYCVRARERDALQAHLGAQGIGTQVYYRTPLDRQPAMQGRADVPCGVPVSDRAAAEVLALPMWPQLGRAQVDEVVTAVASFYQDRGRARGQAGGRAAGGQGVH